MPDPDDLEGPSPRAPRSGATAVRPSGNGIVGGRAGSNRSSGNGTGGNGTGGNGAGGNSTGGNGRHGDADGLPSLPAQPRRPPGPSTKPALVVLGLALFLFGLAFVLELASGSQSRPAPSPSSVATASGAGTQAVPARPLLSQIVSDGQPPDDLLDALALPKGAADVPGSAVDQGIESYDESIDFEVPASQQVVITFFRAQLPFEHWKLLSQGSAPKVAGAYQILAQHPASDGLEWELGVTVDPTLFVSNPVQGSTAPGATTGTTHFTLRLFSQSDDD